MSALIDLYFSSPYLFYEFLIRCGFVFSFSVIFGFSLWKFFVSLFEALLGLIFSKCKSAKKAS